MEQEAAKISKEEDIEELKTLAPDKHTCGGMECLGEMGTEFLPGFFSKILKSKSMSEQLNRNVLMPNFLEEGRSAGVVETVEE